MVFASMKKKYPQSTVTENKPWAVWPRTAFLMYKFLNAPKESIQGDSLCRPYVKKITLWKENQLAIYRKPYKYRKYIPLADNRINLWRKKYI